MDGVDIAVIETDGEQIGKAIAFDSFAYSIEDRSIIQASLGKRHRDETVDRAEELVTTRHIDAVNAFLKATGIQPESIDVIGFHGQTISHDPSQKFTWQIGDGEALMRATGIPVVYDFRSNDVACGGQGAPLAPVYHRAISRNWEGPIVVLNLGGVANVTWIGTDGEMLAFDTGPANSLMDDWMLQKVGEKMDVDGRAAASGTIQEEVLEHLLDNPFFREQPPKSLDRGDFSIAGLPEMSVEDGAATLLAFTVESIALAPFPSQPRHMLVAGGGSRNPTLMKSLQARLPWPVDTIDTTGWSADAIEAQAFAFMAVRSRLGLPITFPGTTGATSALTGGRMVEPG